METRVRDNLTGYYTDSYLEEGISSEVNRARRYGRNLTFLLFDFNIPKKYQVDMFFPIFKRVSKEIKVQTRVVDIKIRLGNRILVILPETDLAGAERAASKIQDNLNGVEFYHAIFDEFFHIKATHSVASYPEDGEEPKNILRSLTQKMADNKETVSEEQS
ncbi:MAG: diguanylate cyclase [Vulcanimicrobiota bacterium]